MEVLWNRNALECGPTHKLTHNEICPDNPESIRRDALLRRHYDSIGTVRRLKSLTGWYLNPYSLFIAAQFLSGILPVFWPVNHRIIAEKGQVRPENVRQV